MIELPRGVIRKFKTAGTSLVPLPVERLVPENREGRHVIGYHLTPRENLSRVRITGLVPQIGLVKRVRGYRLPGIYLTNTIQHIEFIFQVNEYPKSVREGIDAMVIFKVKIPLGTPALRDPELVGVKEIVSFVIFTPIPPMLITPVGVLAMKITRGRYQYSRLDPITQEPVFAPTGERIMMTSRYGVLSRRLLKGPWEEEMATGWSEEMTNSLPEDVTYFGLNW